MSQRIMYKHLFGPVPSRRLGMSLGIDLIPKKVCSLNCVYCEVGKTTELTLDDLHNFLGIHINEINKYLGALEANNKIRTVNLERGVFYQIKHK